MDLAGMTITEKLDILYEDCTWLNNDGTPKEDWESLQQGFITVFLDKHEQMINDLLTINKTKDIARSLYINLGILNNWISVQKRNKYDINTTKRKKKTIPSPTMAKEKSFIETLEDEKAKLYNEIEEIEHMVKDVGKKKKILESIGYLIAQYKEVCEIVTEVSTIDVVQNIKD